MRKRNIKINIFLNEHEKQMLIEKSNKARLSQSDFIRKLIDDFDEKFLSNNSIHHIAKSLQEIFNDLLKLKNKLHYLGYFEDENFLQCKLNDFNFWINKLKK